MVCKTTGMGRDREPGGQWEKNCQAKGGKHLKWMVTGWKKMDLNLAVGAGLETKGFYFKNPNEVQMASLVHSVWVREVKKWKGRFPHCGLVTPVVIGCCRWRWIQEGEHGWGGLVLHILSCVWVCAVDRVWWESSLWVEVVARARDQGVTVSRPWLNIRSGWAPWRACACEKILHTGDCGTSNLGKGRQGWRDRLDPSSAMAEVLEIGNWMNDMFINYYLQLFNQKCAEVTWFNICSTPRINIWLASRPGDLQNFEEGMVYSSLQGFLDNYLFISVSGFLVPETGFLSFCTCRSSVYLACCLSCWHLRIC